MRYTLSTILIIFSVVALAQPKPHWKFRTDGKIYGSPTINDNTLYIGSGDGNLYALDLQTGKETWRFHTKGPITSSALCLNKLVIINSHDGFVYAVDRFTGKEVWRFQTRGEKAYDMWDYYLSSAIADVHTIYIGSGDHFIYALNVNDGQLKWKFETGDVVHATPVVSEGVLYAGSFDGNLYALNAKDGTLRWKFKTVGDKYFPKGEIQRGPVLKDSVLYFGSRDYNVYAVNARTGRGHWNLKEYGAWVVATPTLHNGVVYVGTSDTHRFYALEEDYGQVKWSVGLNMRVYGSAVPDKDRIYFGCFNGKLYGVNAASGTIEWTFQTEGSTKNYHLVYNGEDHFKEGFQIYGNDMNASENTILSLGSVLCTPVIKNDVIYFGSADGNVYAVGL